MQEEGPYNQVRKLEESLAKDMQERRQSGRRQAGAWLLVQELYRVQKAVLVGDFDHVHRAGRINEDDNIR